MWDDFGLALALVLVIEGFLPTVNPAGFKRTMRMLTELDERQIRRWGLVLMVIGAVLIYWIKH
jgi:uncharacterized protein YjeT (DUF2065 family)